MTDYKGFTIDIEPDEDAENPRTSCDGWIAKLCMDHRNYTLPWDIDPSPGSFDDLAELVAYVKDEEGADVVLYVNGYDHGGLAISVSDSTASGWDSGVLGVAFVRRADMIEAGIPEADVTDESMAEMIEAEVKAFDNWSRGDYVGYIIRDEDGDEVPEIGGSVWGFDDEDYAITEAKSMIDWIVEDRAEKAAKLAAEKAEHLAIAQAWATAMRGAA